MLSKQRCPHTGLVNSDLVICVSRSQNPMQACKLSPRGSCALDDRSNFQPQRCSRYPGLSDRARDDTHISDRDAGGSTERHFPAVVARPHTDRLNGWRNRGREFAGWW
jgi:hypothetical protein